MRTCLLFSFLFLCSKLPYAQETGKRDYAPPSPNTMTFMKYGEYSIDQSAGVPSIDIPLYIIDLKCFQFPVSASFHSSGRKVSMGLFPVGLDWSLNAYEMIFTEIRGRSDAIIQPTDPSVIRENYYATSKPISNYSSKGKYLSAILIAGLNKKYWLSMLKLTAKLTESV